MDALIQPRPKEQEKKKQKRSAYIVIANPFMRPINVRQSTIPRPRAFFTIDITISWSSPLFFILITTSSLNAPGIPLVKPVTSLSLLFSAGRMPAPPPTAGAPTALSLPLRLSSLTSPPLSLLLPLLRLKALAPIGEAITNMPSLPSAAEVGVRSKSNWELVR
ncbi:hypothetical protein G7Y79_00042g078170 [Physcia stellaris]|nr:hypothetical protein G7Y79_00042g078170 [Physcia stellaris]